MTALLNFVSNLYQIYSGNVPATGGSTTTISQSADVNQHTGALDPFIVVEVNAQTSEITNNQTVEFMPPPGETVHVDVTNNLNDDNSLKHERPLSTISEAQEAVVIDLHDPAHLAEVKPVSNSLTDSEWSVVRRVQELLTQFQNRLATSTSYSTPYSQATVSAPAPKNSNPYHH
jgi:hypothetical protein